MGFKMNNRYSISLTVYGVGSVLVSLSEESLPDNQQFAEIVLIDELNREDQKSFFIDKNNIEKIKDLLDQ